jgi:multidrug efflux system membrane fusion protein
MDEPHSTIFERERREGSATSGDGSPEAPRPRRRGWLWLLILLAAAAVVYYVWPKRAAPQSSAPAADAKAGGRAGRGAGVTPVVVVKAQTGSIGVYFDGLGAVTPVYTVTVRSRVDGELMAVHYQEGEIVQKGALLAEIDPRPFQVQLTQAQGQLARDQALLDNARIDLARYETLIKQNAVPEQQLVTQKALIEQYQGAIQTDQGAIDSARLNLTYSKITAPIAGRIGLRLVDPGNIVHATDTNGLLVITQLQPISVIFTISEDQLPVVVRKMQAGAHLRVDAYDRDMTTKLASGTLATIDNQIDQTTGTLKLRANFDNSRNELFPNQFVNARLLVEQKNSVTLIPTAAVQRNNQMTYVWLVKPDSSVTVQQIGTGVSEGIQTEVTSGLQPGDVAVMTGVDKLQEGTKVNAQLEGARGNRNQAGAASPANQPAAARPNTGQGAARGAGGGKGRPQQPQ